MDSNDHYLKKELYELFRKDHVMFDFFQQASLDGIWYWDLEHPENEWMSPEFWKILGYEPGENLPLVSECQALIHPDDLKLAQKNLNRHLANPEHAYDQVVRYQHKNGSIVWLRCRGMAIRNNIGKVTRMLGAYNDVTRQMEVEERFKNNLKAIDELYASTKVALDESESLFASIPDAILQVDEQGYIVKFNNEAVKLFGYNDSEFGQLNVDQLVPMKYRSEHGSHRANYLSHPEIRPMGKTRKGIVAINKKQQEIPVEIRLSTVQTRYGVNTIAIIHNVTEQTRLIQSLEETIEHNHRLWSETITDPLTQLYNRRYFEDVSIREFNNSIRHDALMSVMLIDIDHFKVVNDTHGHQAGDIVLKKLADQLKKLVRVGDTLARIGGEEFCILLPTTSALAAVVLAERMRQKIAKIQCEICDDKTLNISVSIGVAEIQADDSNFNSALNRADKALYDAKHQGRNRVVVFE
jgi:diguanylate cyclase (GGDEF)-like protein/PAS domain S-box-containing protein